jgi:hypothetical protein
MEAHNIKFLSPTCADATVNLTSEDGCLPLDLGSSAEDDTAEES